MQYIWKPEYENIPEDTKHDIWIMIVELENAPNRNSYSDYNPCKETAKQMKKKYYSNGDQ